MVESLSGKAEPFFPRVFIGGCSRSGTTFLQRLLAGHSRIHTFPETGVFLKALGMRGRVLPWARLGLSLGKERKALRRLLETVEMDFGPEIPPRRFLLRSSAKDIAGFLDELTRRAGKDLWVEKTPRHVLHASRIRKLVSGSVFLHMVRDGRDVVASIVDRARRFPDRFHRQSDPAYGIAQWNRSMRATEAALREPGHVVVLYETLATEPQETLEALCASIGLLFEKGMLEEQDQNGFVLKNEAWKDPVRGPIRPAESKFEALFDEDTRERINKALDQRFYREITTRLQRGPDQVWAS